MQPDSATTNKMSARVEAIESGLWRLKFMKRKKGKPPVFPADVSAMSDKDLYDVSNETISYFYEALEGGTQFGVDWPTARATFPDECAKLDEIRKEAIARCEKNGMLNGVQYEKTEKGWKPKK